TDAVGLAAIGDEQAAIDSARQPPGLVETRLRGVAVAHAAMAVAGKQRDPQRAVERRRWCRRAGRLAIAPGFEDEAGGQREQRCRGAGGDRARRAAWRVAAQRPVQSSTRQNTALR